MEQIHTVKCEFINEDIEERFRISNLQENKFRTTLGMLGMAVSMLYFVRTDKYYMIDPSLENDIMYLRIFYAIITFSIVFLIRKSKFFQMNDIIVLVWALFTSIVISFINLSRSADFLYHHMTDVIIIMTFYILFPNRLIYQIIPALIFSITNIVIFANLEVISIREVNTVLFGHLSVNILGIYISYKNQYIHRNYFFSMMDKDNTD